MTWSCEFLNSMRTLVVALGFMGSSMRAATITYSVTDLGTLGGRISGASSINAVGQVVGSIETSAGDHAFLWQSGTGMQDLGTLGGDFSSSSAASLTPFCGRVGGYRISAR